MYIFKGGPEVTTVSEILNTSFTYIVYVSLYPGLIRQLKSFKIRPRLYKKVIKFEHTIKFLNSCRQEVYSINRNAVAYFTV